MKKLAHIEIDLSPLYREAQSIEGVPHYTIMFSDGLGGAKIGRIPCAIYAALSDEPYRYSGNELVEAEPNYTLTPVANEETKDYVATFLSADGHVVEIATYKKVTFKTAQANAEAYAAQLGAHCDDWRLTEKKP